MGSTFAILRKQAITIPKAEIAVFDRSEQQNYFGDPFTIIGSTNIPRIGAYWRSDDAEFLNHSPQYWLFRYRRRYHKSRTIDTARQMQTWVHPSHRNGINHPNSNYYSGNHSINRAGPVPLRDTEWPFATLTPYDVTELSIDPNVWMVTPGLTPPYEYQTWGDTNETVMPGMRGTKYAGNSKTHTFKIAIAIRDVNIPGGWRFGPYSELIRYYPKQSYLTNGSGEIHQYFIQWKCQTGERPGNR